RLLASRTSADRGGLPGWGGCLAGQGFVEHLLREDLAEFQEEGFDLGELGAPGGTVGPVGLIDQIFWHRPRLSAALFPLWGCASWPLASPVPFSTCVKDVSELALASVGTGRSSCKPGRAPEGEGPRGGELVVEGLDGDLVGIVRRRRGPLDPAAHLP